MASSTSRRTSSSISSTREVGALRRALVSHRVTFLALTRPEIEGITSSGEADRFRELHSRLEEIVQAARDSRDSVVGSFDVLVARTGQRTKWYFWVVCARIVVLALATLAAARKRRWI